MSTKALIESGAHEGENSYHNLDFTPAMEIIKWQKESMINDHNSKVNCQIIQ